MGKGPKKINLPKVTLPRAKLLTKGWARYKPTPLGDKYKNQYRFRYEGTKSYSPPQQIGGVAHWFQNPEDFFKTKGDGSQKIFLSAETLKVIQGIVQSADPSPKPLALLNNYQTMKSPLLRILKRGLFAIKTGFQFFWKSFYNPKPIGLLMAFTPSSPGSFPDPSTVQNLQNLLRNIFLSQMDGEAHRNSGFTQRNNLQIDLHFDRHSGEILALHQVAFYKGEGRIKVEVIADLTRNRIVVKEGGLEILGRLEKLPKLTWANRQFVIALKTLHNQTLYPETKSNNPQEELVSDLHIPQNQIDRMRKALTVDEGTGGMTVLGNNLLLTYFGNFRTGWVVLDRLGEILGTSLERPGFLGRGIPYDTGLIGYQGGWAKVIVGEEGTLFHFEPDGLTPRQSAALQELFQSPENQTLVQKYLKENPYLIQAILGEGNGKLFVEVVKHLPWFGEHDKNSSVKLAILFKNNRYYFLRDNPRISEKRDRLIALIRIQKNGPKMIFQIERGVVPEKIAKIFHYLQGEDPLVNPSIKNSAGERGK